MCGGFSTGALWGAEQAEIALSPTLAITLLLHHPCQSHTAVGTQTPKGHFCPCCVPASPWGGQ